MFWWNNFIKQSSTTISCTFQRLINNTISIWSKEAPNILISKHSSDHKTILALSIFQIIKENLRRINMFWKNNFFKCLMYHKLLCHFMALIWKISDCSHILFKRNNKIDFFSQVIKNFSFDLLISHTLANTIRLQLYSK